MSPIYGHVLQCWQSMSSLAARINMKADASILDIKSSGIVYYPKGYRALPASGMPNPTVHGVSTH